MRLIINESNPEWDKGILYFLLADTTEKHGHPYTLAIVTVTVKYQPPSSPQIYEMETVFVGQVRKRTYTSMDVLNSV